MAQVKSQARQDGALSDELKRARAEHEHASLEAVRALSHKNEQILKLTTTNENLRQQHKELQQQLLFMQSQKDSS